MLLAWVGWIVGAFAAIQPPRDPVPAIPTAALDGLRARLPGAAQPRAIRLPVACACSGDAASWIELAAAMRARGGEAVVLDAPLPGLAGVAVVVLDPAGTLRYAGPLQPDPALCAGGPVQSRLARWLPALLTATEPLLLAPRDCQC